MPRAVLLALVSVSLLAAGCGGSSASGGDDPAGAVPADAALYADATLRPEGQLREDALAAAGKLLRTADPQAEIDELVEKAFAESEDPHLDYRKDVSTWQGENLANCSVLAGACTLALLVLPVVILSTREALRAVPGSLREGSYALGATKWQTIWYQVLPVALPGILTGLILALSRAIGETAPLITIGALTYVPFLPENIWSPFTVLPIQIFNWVSRPQAGFLQNAAAGIIVLLGLLLTMNATAIWLRDRLQRRRAS